MNATNLGSITKQVKISEPRQHTGCTICNIEVLDKKRPNREQLEALTVKISPKKVNIDGESGAVGWKPILQGKQPQLPGADATPCMPELEAPSGK